MAIAGKEGGDGNNNEPITLELVCELVAANADKNKGGAFTTTRHGPCRRKLEQESRTCVIKSIRCHTPRCLGSWPVV